MVLSALQICGQTQQDASNIPQNPQQKPSTTLAPVQPAYPQTEVLLTIGCRHADRKTPYKEFNPGLLFMEHTSPYSSATRGFYYNSHGQFAPTAGTINEANFRIGNSNFTGKFGLAICFINYRHKQHDFYRATPANVTVFDELPPNEKSRGREAYYMRLEDGRCMKMEYFRNRHAAGNSDPRFAVFAIASLLYKDNGVFCMGTFGPNLKSKGRWGELVAYGLRLNTTNLIEKAPTSMRPRIGMPYQVP